MVVDDASATAAAAAEDFGYSPSSRRVVEKCWCNLRCAIDEKKVSNGSSQRDMECRVVRLLIYAVLKAKS